MNGYLLDTHAFIFWVNDEELSEAFIQFLDDVNAQGKLYVSTATFWEVGLLIKKDRIQINNVHLWQTEVLEKTQIQTLSPSITEMLLSTELDDHHKDPFDRLFIAQALHNSLEIVTKDSIFPEYDVPCFWMK
jgi:PIN domain nuclease of toxin-antitoxin system